MDNDKQAIYLQEAVKQAFVDNKSLKITGGSSKSFYGNQVSAEPLSTCDYQGIVNYHPSELVITVKAGTLLSEIDELLAKQGQMLAFEPPSFAPSATIGGTVACGFSGNRRPFCGSVRDFVLGCKIINGQGEVLQFGGEVMKNVAGYDVSRLMVGARGTLGIILEISLKVLPRPALEKTFQLELELTQAINKMTELSSICLPLSGLSYYEGILSVRLSGAEKTIVAAQPKIGGEELMDSSQYWQDLNEQKLDFFQTSKNLWRLSVPPASSKLALEGECFYDWGGAQRWLKSDSSADEVFSTAIAAEGHATLFKSNDYQGDRFSPLSKPLLRLQQNLKHAFDPHLIFNPQN